MSDRSNQRLTRKDRDERKKLTAELSALKRKHARIMKERDQLAAEEKQLMGELEGLGEAKIALSRMINELQEMFQRIQQMQQELEDFYEVREFPQVKAYLEAKHKRQGEPKLECSDAE